MDSAAFSVSLRLAFWTAVLLLPLALVLGRWLALTPYRGKSLVQALLLLPLLLPPTVLGFYALMALGQGSALGQWLQTHWGLTLVFRFEGLLLVSVLINLPFMVQPIERAFAAVPRSVREAAWVSGLSRSATLWRIELPLVWPGLLAGLALTAAHTLGEFGVVLMVGGNIPGETRTVSVALYDHVQMMEFDQAHALAASLLVLAVVALALVMLLDRPQHRQAWQGRAEAERT